MLLTRSFKYDLNILNVFDHVKLAKIYNLEYLQ